MSGAPYDITKFVDAILESEVDTETLPPDPDEQNEDRSEWAEAALIEFHRQTGSDLEDSMCDLLCDLMHFADRHGMNFDAELSRAVNHYHAETQADEE